MQLPDETGAVLRRQQHAGTGLADALQGLDRDLEVADVEDRQLQLDVAYRRHRLEALLGKGCPPAVERLS